LDCEKDLDDFHRYRKENKPKDISTVYYGESMYPADQKHDYQKKCRSMSISMTDYVTALNYRLDNLLKGYMKKK
jgi:hypothetical protein